MTRPSLDLTGKRFALAVIEMLNGAPWRRRDWQGHVFLSVVTRFYWYVWPSGHMALWHPTPEDLAANDWEPSYGLGPDLDL